LNRPSTEGTTVSDSSATLEESLVRSLRVTLAELVLPAVDDPWAASYLRSSLSVLAALQARLAVGGRTAEWEAQRTRELLAALGLPSGSQEEDVNQLRLRLEDAIGRAYADGDPGAQTRELLDAYRDEVLEAQRCLWHDASRLDQM
jgi:hypothetical protein